MADPGRRRAAADSAVHLFELARYHRRDVRGGDQRRPQLLARDSHRRHAARPQSAGRQQQRDVAADRGGRRSSSSRPARSAPNIGGGQTAVANFVVKSGTNDFHGSGAVYLQDAQLRRAAVRRQGAQPAHAVARAAEWRRGGWRPDHAAAVQRAEPQLLLHHVREDAPREQTSTAFRTLPTREFQNGDFSRLFDPGYTGDARSGTVVGTDALGRPIRFGQIYDPRTTRVVDSRVVRDPFPNNQIPRALWDTVARNTIDQDLWDAPSSIVCSTTSRCSPPAARCSTRTRSRSNTIRSSTATTGCRST